MRRLARIGPRLLLFNLLLLFVPVAGVLTLETYERQLLAAQERSMVQQARLVAAALGGGGEIDAEAARGLLARLGGRVEARLRVVGREGLVIADSAASGPSREAGTPRRSDEGTRERLLYRLGAALGRLVLPAPSLEAMGDAAEAIGPGPLLGPEILAALSGRYGTATRLSPGQRSLTLYGALPVRDGSGEVVAAVLASQSTSRVLGELRALRLDLFEIALVSLLAAALLSLVAAATVSRPLARLAAEADALPDPRHRLRGAFAGTRRPDEIGELARALERLSRRLDEQLAASEGFAADLAHEFKNPLASIRAATEMLAVVETEEEREHFLGLVEREVARLDRLLSGVHELTRLDAGTDAEPRERFDLAAELAGLLEGFRVRAPHLSFALRAPAGAVEVNGSPTELVRVFENLLDNAVGFSPPGGQVEVTLAARAGEVRATVADQGPGVPAGDRERVFERFFSSRSQRPGNDGPHDGLGLAIARSLVESHGGTLTLAESAAPGAVFEVRLPRAGG